MRWIAVLVVVCAAHVARADDPVLPGRPDATVDATGELGAPFTSLAAGIELSPPLGCKEIRRTVSGDEIVQFVSDARKWQIRVSRVNLSKPAPLISDESPDPKTRILRKGMLESNVEQLKLDMGGAEVLRQDLVNIGELPVGVIAARYKVANVCKLTQRAVIQASEMQYFVIDFTSPAPESGPVESSPEVKLAVSTFAKVLDSVKLIDQTKLVEDQNQRLFRTRALFVNLTEPRVRAALVPEQWLRLIQDGKDIGYSYVVEEEAQGLPGKNERNPAGGTNGFRVGVRSRSYPGKGDQVDAATWMWVSFDRKHEIWSNRAQMDSNGKRTKVGEFGSSDRQTVRYRDESVGLGEKRPDGSVDQAQPGVRQGEEYKLMVTQVDTPGASGPVNRDLPPFYLPQAIAQILPRLLPRNEPKTYLFASYVGEQRDVVKRFIDVGVEQEVKLLDKTFRAIPIKDRIGLEGVATIHYVSPDGRYLGSENKESKVVILPTTAEFLQQKWKDADLSRPGAPDEAGK